MLAANERYEEALEELIESVRIDRAFADGAARKAALAIFDILGLDSPVTREYQAAAFKRAVFSGNWRLARRILRLVYSAFGAHPVGTIALTTFRCIFRRG